MINALHLLLICPLCAAIGFATCALLSMGKDDYTVDGTTTGELDTDKTGVS